MLVLVGHGLMWNQRAAAINQLDSFRVFHTFLQEFNDTAAFPGLWVEHDQRIAVAAGIDLCSEKINRGIQQFLSVDFKRAVLRCRIIVDRRDGCSVKIVVHLSVEIAFPQIMQGFGRIGLAEFLCGKSKFFRIQ